MAAASDPAGVWSDESFVAGPPRAPRPNRKAGLSRSTASGSAGTSAAGAAGAAGASPAPRPPRPPRAVPPRPVPPRPPPPRPPRASAGADVSVQAATNSSLRLSGDQSVRLILIASPAPLTLPDVAVKRTPVWACALRAVRIERAKQHRERRDLRRMELLLSILIANPSLTPSTCLRSPGTFFSAFITRCFDAQTKKPMRSVASDVRSGRAIESIAGRNGPAERSCSPFLRIGV